MDQQTLMMMSILHNCLFLEVFDCDNNNHVHVFCLSCGVELKLLRLNKFKIKGYINLHAEVDTWSFRQALVIHMYTASGGMSLHSY